MTETVPIRLREGCKADVGRIRAMILGLAHATGEAHKVRSEAADFLRHGFGPAPLFDTILAERGDDAVGLCLYFFTFSTWLGEPGVYVQDVYVDPAERGQGLGRRLIAAAAARGAARRATHLRLTVASSNEDAKRFYTRLGMEHRDREDTYHLGGEAFSRLAESGP